MTVAVGVALVAIVRLAGWSFSELSQGASVAGLIVSLVALVVGLTQREETQKPGPVLDARNPLAGLPRLDRDNRRIAVRQLGVHPAIPLPPGKAKEPGLDPDLPNWVERDRAGDVREWLTKAKEEGGFLVLAGNSSVGKTRLLFETALDVLEGWPILICSALGNGTPVNELALRTDELTEGVVVWLDELHRFLPGPDAGKVPVTAATIAHLTDAHVPVIILAAFWPTNLHRMRATRQRPDGTLEPIYPEAADALRDVRIMNVDSLADTGAEAAAARAAADKDPRLVTALGDPHFGVTEALAGAPLIIERYETATPVQKALLWAAIDAQRVGLHPPLTTELLTAAARGYLTDVHPTDDWAETALAELSRSHGPHDRATAPLVCVRDATNPDEVGYEVADYLLQHATPTRRSVRIPPTTWQALIDHTDDADALIRLGESAERRGLKALAVAALRKSATADSTAEAAERLVDVLAWWDDIEELRALADAGDEGAARGLVNVLADRGDLEELRALADAGDTWAARRLAVMLAERGDLDPLRSWADAGDEGAEERLADVLVERGDLEELRARADAGDGSATFRLVDVLAERGDLEKLRARADAGDEWAALRLAEVLADRGDLALLRALADTRKASARARLAEVLAERGDLEELRTRADAGDESATFRLAGVLAERGDLEELRARADAGWGSAALRLAEVLAERGDLEELRARADAGGEWAAARLADVLVDRGDLEELRALADAGGEWAAARLADVLVERGDLEELRALADAGGEWAAVRLVQVLFKRGDLDGLREEVNAGTPEALLALRTADASTDSSAG